MSKTIQQSLVILVVLLVISVGAAVVTLLQKQTLQKQNEYLQTQNTEYETKEREQSKKLKDMENEAKGLRQDIEQKNKDVGDLQRKVSDAKADSDRLTKDIDKVQKERSDLDGRMTTLRRERDDLMDKVEKLKNAPPKIEEKIVEKIVYRDRPVEQQAPDEEFPITPPPQTQKVQEQATSTTFVVQNNANEEYWAGVMREKASLELQLTDVKKKFNDSALKIEDMKKANSDLEMELGRLKNEREEILRKIKYGEDLADSLSVELARARNEQKVVYDRAERVGTENQALRTEIKQLTSTKVALEKSISRLSDDKNLIEKKLVETENIIQSRIDEIWQIKKDVDTRFDLRRNSSSEVELAPIVVTNTAPANKQSTQIAPVKRSGSVVSVNEENNFVILDLGEKDGVRVGDTFKIYRDKNPIGVVSVIQVRKDIVAADIKQRTMPFKAGDVAR